MKKQRSSLKNKKVLLGVAGSVAACKAVDLARRLKEKEASVAVVMTEASTRFVTPLSMSAASGSRAFNDIFEDPMAHIDLPRDADLMIVAPATANIIGKFASGIADDLLSACFVAFRGKVLVAPAMNWRMYTSPVVKRNLASLMEMGVVEVPPEQGRLACGEEGVGRMAEPGTIVEEAEAALSEKDLAGKKVVVTAGPTREHLDPVRFISNMSSGKMGYALARAARRRGADVTLISGPTALQPPGGVRFVSVVSASGMRDEVMAAIRDADVLIMAAAVSDFSPAAYSSTKISKSSVRGAIKVEPSPDILAEAGRKRKRPLLIGFAAETGAGEKRARQKLLAKGADLVVLNDVTEPGSGFGTDTNRIVLISKRGTTDYPLMSKDEAADRVLDWIVQ